MINTLKISNFRNHFLSTIKSDGFQNIIITGPNGSGKTAILESISMFSGNGTLRGANMIEIARTDDNMTGGFSVAMELSDDTTLSMDWTAGDAYRRFRIDNDAAPIANVTKHLRLCWITPREDRLFVEGASERRAFFDRLCASFDPAHSGRTARLSKLLSERGFALKSRASDHWLAPIENQIAETATAIAAARVKYAGEINYELGMKNEEIGIKKEQKNNSSPLTPHSTFVTLSGWLEDRLNANKSAGEVEAEYLEYMKSNRELVGDKMSIEGAHRSDFSMFNTTLNKPANMLSTGQQKMALLSLVISHARLIHTKTHARPVILLDEVIAHLDTISRKTLFDELSRAEAQVWATGIDADNFPEIQNAIFITCDNGTVSVS